MLTESAGESLGRSRVWLPLLSTNKWNKGYIQCTNESYPVNKGHAIVQYSSLYIPSLTINKLSDVYIHYCCVVTKPTAVNILFEEHVLKIGFNGVFCLWQVAASKHTHAHVHSSPTSVRLTQAHSIIISQGHVHDNASV